MSRYKHLLGGNGDEPPRGSERRDLRFASTSFGVEIKKQFRSGIIRNQNILTILILKIKTGALFLGLSLFIINLHFQQDYPYRSTNNPSDYISNGFVERFGLIGETFIRSNRWCNPMKITFLLCCLPFRKADDTANV